MPKYERERLNAKFSITIDRTPYLELKNFNDTTQLKDSKIILISRMLYVSYKIMGMNNSTQGVHGNQIYEEKINETGRQVGE